MAFRDWHWPQWMLLIGGILLTLLFGVVVYVLLTPTAFQPVPARPGQVATGELPQIQPGGPTFPPSDIERIPLTQIQSTNVDQGPDLVASGGLTQVDNVTQFP